MQTRVKWDQNMFDRILADYLTLSSRELVVALNTKGFYIARAATRLTLKAGQEKITAGLGKIVPVHLVSKKGTSYFRKGLILTKGTNQGNESAPLAALILNSRQARHGDDGLYGRDMKWAIRHLIGARRRSNAFIASGWIDAIKALEPLAERGRRPEMASATEMKRYGVPKGEAIPAIVGSNIVCQIINKAIAKRDKKDAIGKYGGDGLRAAFEHEINSMISYIEKKLHGPTSKANRRL